MADAVPAGSLNAKDMGAKMVFSRKAADYNVAFPF